MDKTQLQKIFSTSYNHQSWLEVLKNVFGARRLLMQAKPISLPTNDISEGAFELGSFTTSDDRIIGLYKVDVKSNVWLERNKVGLRKLLREVYEYNVDGALIVFVQDNKWRLSFVSEIKVLNDEGEIIQQTTEPKRYTYLLGEKEKVRTPSDRLSKLIGKPISLMDILNTFSVEVLNEEFYKIIQSFFYELVGGTVGNSKKENKYEGVLRLPNVSIEDKQIYKEFAVRLIGRTVFCWFLKMKKANDSDSLISEELLSSKAVKKNKEYYHMILERLFFQTLNTPMDERLENLPMDCEKVPFLNGGLFEPGNDDYYRFDKLTSLSENINTLKISDDWFIAFFEELEKYNFTIDENSVTDLEVSVDPEMLGRIFENLLAEIDPDSGDTARKATGSFYTPREIVDYMAIESLVQYIHNKTSIDHERLRPIFKMMENGDVNFNETERIEILKALDTVKILDPACGSGAFPMGVLQKIVIALQKLDKNAQWWIQQRINENKNATARKAVKEKLEGNSQYARKIGIIQNSLYGVDIQPIAAEISKLRCFLTLVVDEQIDSNKPNRGIDPLPNLEFKFVTANTLANLPDPNERGGLFDHFEELEELEQLRTDYLQSSGREKQKIKQRFPDVQNKIFKDQLNLFVDLESRAYKLSTWDPFGHVKADWFDPKWMYGVEKFDIVIGNPPYVLLQNAKLSENEQNKLRKTFITAQYKTDLYHLFIEQGLNCVNELNGVLCYITPNTYLKNKHNDLLRKFILNNSHVIEVIRFYVPIFKNASVDNAIIIANRKQKIENEQIRVKDISNINYSSLYNIKSISIPQISLMNKDYLFDFDQFDNEILVKIGKCAPLIKFGRAYFGIQTFDRPTYVSKEKINEDYKPVVDGTNVGRFLLKSPKEYVMFAKQAIKSGGNISVYEKERILVRQIGKFPEGCLCSPGIYTLNTIYNIYVHDKEKTNIRFLLSVLNSKTVQYYWKKIHSDNKETFPKIKKDPLESIPVPNIGIQQQSVFAKLVDIISLLKSLGDLKQINEFVPNSHVTILFEEILDTMVMELYFKEDFEKAKIEIIKFVERDFESIEAKNDLEQNEIIHRAYQKIREKDNEIRSNMKLMDIKLADIVVPIKTTR